MRLTTFLLLIGCLHASANGHSQTISYSGRAVPAEILFRAIKQQTGYAVVCSKALLKDIPPVTIDARQLPLQTFLAQVFYQQPFDFTILGKTVSISRKRLSLLPDSVRLYKPVDVKGRVLNENGEPLMASIQVKGSSKGTTSDASGFFELQTVDDQAVLLVTGVNIEPLEVKLGGRSSIEIRVRTRVGALDETVVMAYGTTSRRLNTGNITRVGRQEIERQPVSNPLATLDGLVPGLVVTQTSGVPGAGFKVELRGRTAIDRRITDDQPLFLIDGVPFGPNNGWLSTMASAVGQPSQSYAENLQGGASPLDNINPQDIESIEILKDADATAIYGSRGANGVVLITTRKGKAGKLKIDFNNSLGAGRVGRKIRMLNTAEYLAMRNKAYANDNSLPTTANGMDMLAWDTTRYSNLFSQVQDGRADLYSAQLSLSGGNAQTQFLVSGAYRRETMLVDGPFANRRTTFHFNINHASADNRFKLLLSGGYTDGLNLLPRSDPYGTFLISLPHLKLYEDDGSLAMNEGGYTSGNPLANLKFTYAAGSYLMQGNLQLSYQLTKDLLFRTSLGYNTTQMDETSRNPGAAQNPANTINRTVYINTSRIGSWLLEPQLEYNRVLGGGQLKLLAGATLQSTDNAGTAITATGFSSDDQMGAIGAATTFTATSSKAEYRYQALFGRASYNWQQKYLVNVSARRDGSSRFGPGKQFATFAAAGAGWIFTNEKWLQDIDWLSFGKLRASYGTTGNDKISNYQYLDTWMATPSTYDNTGGLYPNKLFNPDYRWEKTEKLELAAELGFLKDRILLSLAWYQHRSSNQLVQYRLANMSGLGNVVANLPATVVNNGWEIMLNATPVKTTRFSWEATFNITVPRNRLQSFPGLANSSYANTYVEGQPLNLIYAYRNMGVDPATGFYAFEDLDKNGLINAADMQALGHRDPLFYGGLGNTLRYKQWTLDCTFSFRKQTGVNFLNGISNTPGSRFQNLPAAMNDLWEQPGQEAKYQRLGISGTANTTWTRFRSASNGIYSDASFIRLRNLQLAYQLPATLLGRAGISNARCYLQGQNLLTITGYEVGDPESQNLRSTPPLLTLTAGIQITL
ncbi:MAG: SusC/RagA family TonB-linked outer membrane protein [Candidatus Pseudobacter hemicellulosilyticus]|uniref:SusC/RagA family TonB-linked outer membrane protein n=1 Tax=Candidatus Pseudobacter hemicellulosilyticus TaxID=3121375 RepID=A0AAJ5WV56_9BACT|nr:MAG: SusC/RagA family TonB-linked outer membrane protein [Pseudobacter sp.]